VSHFSSATRRTFQPPFTIELRSAGTIAQGWFDNIHLYAEASAAGTIATVDSAYIPIPADHPEYAARSEPWPGFTAFGGGGTLDPAPSPVPEPSTWVAGALLLLVLGVQGARSLRRRQPGI
jgi:hypothetical protein